MKTFHRLAGARPSSTYHEILFDPCSLSDISRLRFHSFTIVMKQKNELEQNKLRKLPAEEKCRPDICRLLKI